MSSPSHTADHPAQATPRPGAPQNNAILSTYGHGDDTEYVYIHPDTPEGQQLEASGFRLPTPDDFVYPPIGAPTPATTPATTSQATSLNNLSHAAHAPGGNAAQGPPPSGLKRTYAIHDLNNRKEMAWAHQRGRIGGNQAPYTETDQLHVDTSNATAPADETALATATPLTGVGRKISSSDLLILSKAVVEKRPFFAPHGRKAQTWGRLLKYCIGEGLSSWISAVALRLKAEDMVLYTKKPQSRKTGAMVIATILQANPADATAMASFLDQMVVQWDESQGLGGGMVACGSNSPNV